MTYEVLKNIQTFIDKMNASNKRKDKEDVLLTCMTPDVKWILKLTFDYDVQYYITSKSVEKLKNSLGGATTGLNLFEVLDRLRLRLVTGHAAAQLVHSFVLTYPEYKDLIYKIIDKDLGIGVSTKIINDVHPGMIKEFKVALAQDLRKKPNTKLDQDWVIERKLDGNRAILIYNNPQDIHIYSRTGLEYTTLNKIKEDVVKLGLDNDTVLDGEICLVDENDHEDFQGIMKEIRRKDHTIPNPKYIVFDMMPLPVFEGKETGLVYKDRIQPFIDKYTELDPDTIKTITPIEYVDYSEENLTFMKKCVVDDHWEGLMFRKNVPYEGKRTDNLLKFKSFFDAEYEVLDIEESEVTEVINNKANKIKAVGSLLIKHQGYTVKVGSGLSLEQRKAWLQNPDQIIGKTITVKYFEETTDQNGNKSLRFPTLVVVHGEEREI